MDIAPGVIVVFLVVAVAGAVGFAVYYGFFNKNASKMIQRYASYSFILYLGFPISILLGVFVALGMIGYSDIPWVISPLYFLYV